MNAVNRLVTAAAIVVAMVPATVGVALASDPIPRSSATARRSTG